MVQVGAVSGRQLADQPPNVDPAAGVAVRVTVAPAAYSPVQAEPPTAVQLITPSELVTVPLPRPTRYMLSCGNSTPPEELVTVRVAVPAIVAPELEIPLAVIVVVPVEFATANPVALTVATFTSLDCHVTEFVRSNVVGALEYVPIAMNWLDSPVVVTVCELGIIAMEVRPCVGWPTTDRSAEPLTPPTLARMVVSPVLTPVASPPDVIEATPASLDVHVTSVVMSRCCDG